MSSDLFEIRKTLQWKKTKIEVVFKGLTKASQEDNYDLYQTKRTELNQLLTDAENYCKSFSTELKSNSISSLPLMQLLDEHKAFYKSVKIRIPQPPNKPKQITNDSVILEDNILRDEMQQYSTGYCTMADLVALRKKVEEFPEFTPQQKSKKEEQLKTIDDFISYYKYHNGNIKRYVNPNAHDFTYDHQKLLNETTSLLSGMEDIQPFGERFEWTRKDHEEWKKAMEKIKQKRKIAKIILGIVLAVVIVGIITAAIVCICLFV